MTKVTVDKVWNGDSAKVAGKRMINKSIYEIGLVVEGQAKLLCPVDFGYLRASITTQSVTEGTELGTVKPDSSKPRISKKTRQRNFWEKMPEGFRKIEKPPMENEVHVGTAVDYAPHMEFGTVKTYARPFLRPALDLAKGRTLNIIELFGKFFFAEYTSSRDVFHASRQR